jgi:hypothetical protein
MPSRRPGLADNVSDQPSEPAGIDAVRNLVLSLPAVTDLLQDLVDRHAAPTAVGCAIAVRYGQRAQCLVSSDEQAGELASAELGGDGGPVAQALATAGTVLGVAGTRLAIPLRLNGSLTGVFAAYSEDAGGFTAADQDLFEHAADQAAGVLAALASIAGILEAAGDPAAMLADRGLIDTAVGVLMARDELAAAQAWAALARIAAVKGVDLDVAARHIVG